MSYTVVVEKFKVQNVGPDELEAALNRPPAMMGFEMKFINVFQENRFNKGPSGGLTVRYRIVWEIIPIQSEASNEDGA